MPPLIRAECVSAYSTVRVKGPKGQPTKVMDSIEFACFFGKFKSPF